MYVHLQGSKYWRFTDKKMSAGYPKEISVGFAGIPNDVDTAFVWSGNGKTYFFKGSVTEVMSALLTQLRSPQVISTGGSTARATHPSATDIRNQ